jgi:hypothetical protein
MVTINELKISEDCKTIEINVSTEVANTIDKILLWNHLTYKNEAKAFDLSSHLVQTGPNEVLSILATDIGLTNIYGIFYLEFTSSEAASINTTLGIATNFVKVHNCFLNKILKIEKIKGCLSVSSSDCFSCENDIFLLSGLLESIYVSIPLQFFEETNKIYTLIEDTCDICDTCPDYTELNLVPGFGFKTVNNLITLV